MTGGHSNSVAIYDESGRPVFFTRERRIFLSLDVDLTRIRCRSKVVRGVLSAINVIKVPFPAVSLSGSGLKLHPVR